MNLLKRFSTFQLPVLSQVNLLGVTRSMREFPKQDREQPLYPAGSISQVGSLPLRGRCGVSH